MQKLEVIQKNCTEAQINKVRRADTEVENTYFVIRRCMVIDTLILIAASAPIDVRKIGIVAEERVSILACWATHGRQEEVANATCRTLPRCAFDLVNFSVLVNCTFYKGMWLCDCLSVHGEKDKHILFSLYTCTPFNLSPFAILGSPTHPTPSHLPTPFSDTCTPLNRNRETIVLDLFIVLKVHDDVWAEESELHLGQLEAFRDLFDLMQPCARLEDLLCAYLASSRLYLTAYSITFTPRRVGVVGPSCQTIVDVERAKDENLEVAAKHLSRKLKEYLVARQWCFYGFLLGGVCCYSVHGIGTLYI